MKAQDKKTAKDMPLEDVTKVAESTVNNAFGKINLVKRLDAHDSFIKGKTEDFKKAFDGFGVMSDSLGKLTVQIKGKIKEFADYTEKANEKFKATDENFRQMGTGVKNINGRVDTLTKGIAATDKQIAATDKNLSALIAATDKQIAATDKNLSALIAATDKQIAATDKNVKALEFSIEKTTSTRRFWIFLGVGIGTLAISAGSWLIDLIKAL